MGFVTRTVNSSVFCYIYESFPYSNDFLKLQIYYGQNLNLILDFFIITILLVSDLRGWESNEPTN